jgi:iron complex outermembrane receptor protein
MYVEMESEYADRFLIGLAGRYEHYSDAGNNLAGKLAIRYNISKQFSIRGSVNNGFRAPSLQQRYMSFTRLSPAIINGVFLISTQGIFRNNSDVAGAFGISSLQAERSMNVSGGITVNLHQGIRLTIDAYSIHIKNRIVLSGIFDRRINQDVNNLLSGISDVNQVQFFVNAISTRTKGLDVVLNGNWKIGKDDLVVMLSANFTQTRLYGEVKKAGNLKTDSLNNNTLFGIEEKTKLEKGQPSDKIILSLNYRTGKTGFIIRNTRFGKTAIAPAFTDPVTRVTSFLYETFNPRILTDISINHSLKKWLTVSLGANNIFNIYPDKLNDYRNTGEGNYIYGQEASPFGFNGGYYFISMELMW